MSARYPAQCPRGVSSNSHPVCITDAMLRQAAERYQHISRVQCRAISTQRGPLESRRRLGKRHMTGFMPSSVMFPQPWHFEVIPDTASWRWEPPSTAEARKSKGRDMSASGMFNSFIGWLEKSDADKPFLTPPAIETAPMLKMTGEAAALASEPDIRIIERNDATYTSQFPELSFIRDELAQLQDATIEQVRALLGPYRYNVTQSVMAGSYTAAQLVELMEALNNTALQTGIERIDRKFASEVAHAIVDGITAAPVAISERLWLPVCTSICHRRGSSDDVRLFRRLMGAMPTAASHKLSASHVTQVANAFITSQASRSTSSPHWSIRANKFAMALEYLSLPQLSEIQSQISIHLSTPRLRFAWLSVVAHSSALSHAQFAELIAADVLTDTQVWQLCTAHLNASKVISREEYQQLISATYKLHPQRWSSLIQTLAKSTTASKELHTILSSINAVDTLIHNLSLSPPPTAAISAFAMNCNDHNIAIQIHDAIPRRWSTSSWAPYIESIINDPIVEHRLFSLLQIMSRPSTHNECKSTIASKMQLLDRVAAAYTKSATHLTDRQRLRRIENCATKQYALSSSVSPKTLVYMADLVTKDLTQGKWGRTSRLDWLMELVKKHQGSERAKRTAVVLQGWRKTIDESNGR